jgi:hypothetical protein
MALTPVQRTILYSLGQFYLWLNQPLKEKHLQVKTSKIAFIEMILDSGIFSKHERAVYRNLEDLEKNKYIEYDKRRINFTERGIIELEKINQEIKQFSEIDNYFKNAQKPKRKLQTVIN